MPQIPFPQFLKRYGIRLLFSSSPEVVPGVLIEKRKKGFYVVGMLNQILSGDQIRWASKIQPGNMVHGNVKRSLSLKGKSSLNEFGIEVSGGLKNAYAVDFQIVGVKQRTFKVPTQITMREELFNLRTSNKSKWKFINNKWIADYVYYADEVKVKFEVEGGINLKADIKDNIKLIGDAGINWTSNKSFTITQNQEVPFGFSGWQI